MARVEVLGPRELFAAALLFLQERGVLELRAPSLPGAPPLRPPAPAGPPDAEARLEEALRRIDALAARLPPAPPEAAEPFPEPGGDAFSARLAALERAAGALEARREALAREREATARFEELVVALAPLERVAGAVPEPELHGLVLETDPTALALLEGEVRRLTGGTCEVKARALDERTTGVLVVVSRSAGRALSSLLFERGVDEVRLPLAYAGRAIVDVLFLLAERGRKLPGELAAAEAAFAAFAARAGPALADARRRTRAALERRRAAAGCGETRFAFVVTGYMPAKGVPALREAAAEALGPRVSVLSRPPCRGEWPDVPVVLGNRAAFRPFERLLALVPLPRYGSVDPTPWLALFFPLFFGVVLGDVAFGVLGIAASLAARARRLGGAAGRDLATIALWCSVSAAVFGVLFGEALGELGGHVGLHPLLLDRRRGFMTFLGLVLGFGGVHVAIGMALGVASAVKGGHAREAVARAAKLLLLASAAAIVGTLGGALPRAALVPLLAALGGLLLVAVAAEGPLAALDLVLGLGNVLSYSRLMALGLASVMLAEVANGVATSLAPAAAALTLAVLLHAVNFSLGLVSPTIAALRLHYVEFFEKFYDPGGAPFRPFASR
jgi:V/A-type H+-transporting ATPase subunit I